MSRESFSGDPDTTWSTVRAAAASGNGRRGSFEAARRGSLQAVGMLAAEHRDRRASQESGEFGGEARPRTGQRPRTRGRQLNKSFAHQAHLLRDVTRASEPYKKRKGGWQIWRISGDPRDEHASHRAFTAVRELLVYAAFLTVSCILAFGSDTIGTYNVGDAVTNLFTSQQINPPLPNTWSDIGSTDDFWLWAEGPMLSGLYPTEFYNGDSMGEYEQGFVLDSKLLGVPRFRMLKVANGSCTVPEAFQQYVYGCYAPYSPNVEDEEPQHPATAVSDLIVDAMLYKTQLDLDGRPFRGEITEYSGGGYVQNLARTSANSTAIVAQLKSNLWIQQGTRALFLDFFMYNANVNLFSSNRFLFEFPASGGVVVSKWISAYKLLGYVSAWDQVLFFLQITFVAFIAYYTVEELLELKHHGFWGWITHSLWTTVELLIILLSWAAIGLIIFRHETINAKVAEATANAEEYPAQMEHAVYWANFCELVVAWDIFLIWLKTLKYLSFNKTMTQMSRTLSRCARDIGGFILMLLIVILAYAELGNLVFGGEVFGFQTLSDSFYTLFRIILGDFDFYAMETQFPTFGPLYFITFVFVVFFILINVFLAIINDSYIMVKQEMEISDEVFEVQDYIQQQANLLWNRMRHWRRKRAVVDTADALDKAINGEGEVSVTESEINPNKRASVKKMFAVHDEDKNNVLDRDEAVAMKADLEQKAEALRKATDSDVTNANVGAQPHTARSPDSESEDEHGVRGRRGKALNFFSGAGADGHVSEMLVRRVDRLEHALGSIIAKVDSILVKVESMEMAQLKDDLKQERRRSKLERKASIGAALRGAILEEGEDGEVTIA